MLLLKKIRVPCFGQKDKIVLFTANNVPRDWDGILCENSQDLLRQEVIAVQAMGIVGSFLADYQVLA
jgi:hypothetical protein